MGGSHPLRARRYDFRDQRLEPIAGGDVCCRKLLHRNMSTPCQSLQIGLEDLLGDLQFARRTGDLGRMALLAYCEVRRWARLAGEQALAEQSSRLINNRPHPNREAFMADVDLLILGLEQARCRVADATQNLCNADSVTN